MPRFWKTTAPGFGRYLRARRVEVFGKQEAAALAIREQLGTQFSASNLQQFETGQRVPDWPILAAMSLVYRVSVYELLDQLVLTIEFPRAS